MASRFIILLAWCCLCAITVVSTSQRLQWHPGSLLLALCCHCAITVVSTSQRLSPAVTKRGGPYLPMSKSCSSAALSRAVSSEPIASGSSSASVDRIFVSADISADAADSSKVSSTRQWKWLPEHGKRHGCRISLP